MATTTLTLSDFLLARIAEDEARVDTAPEFDEVESARGPGWGNRGDCPICGQYQFDGTESVTKEAWWEHVETYHQRHRVLAECESKRRIVALHSGDAEWCGWTQGGEGTHDQMHNGFRVPVYCETLHALALPYADHPDYDGSWLVA